MSAPLDKGTQRQIIDLVCPHCRQGRAPRFREATREWVHDFVEGSQQSHTICWATGFRTSELCGG